MKKMTDQELKDLNQLDIDYRSVIYSIGQIETEITRFEEKLKTLMADKKDFISTFLILEEKNKTLTKLLVDKYGQGQISLETGEIN